MRCGGETVEEQQALTVVARARIVRDAAYRAWEAAIRDARNHGTSYRRIGAEAGVDAHTVRKICREA